MKKLTCKFIKKASKFLAIFVLAFAWIFSGWPPVWNFPPEIQEARADTANILPNAKHANDDTLDTLAGITGDDATENPDTTSAMDDTDNIYTVDKGKVMQIDTFDVTSISNGSTISAAVLHLQYGAENGYNGTNYVRYDNGTGLTNTTIQPTDITGWSSDLTYDLHTQGVDTKTELQNIDIEFTSNDGAGPDAIHFDYAWIAVTYIPPTVSLTVSDGDVSYGLVATTDDTTSSGENETQTITNGGDVNEDFDIIGYNSSPDTWLLQASAGDGIYAHKWCIADCDTTPSWTAITTSYTTLDTAVAPLGTTELDLQVTVPTSNAGTNQQDVNVMVRASAS